MGLNDAEIAAGLVALIDSARYVLDVVGFSKVESLAGRVEGICR